MATPGPPDRRCPQDPRRRTHRFRGLGVADPPGNAGAGRRASGPQCRPPPFLHIALKTTQAAQDGIKARLEEAEWEHFGLDHGYCVSLYATDPDGLIVEFTVDHAKVDEISATRRASAHTDL